jgi:protein-tyrosine phosphatase
MADLLAWQNVEDQRAHLGRATEVLRNGGLVAFPTETVYGVAAHALCPAAVERLVHCKGRPEDKPLTLALDGPAEGADWVPGMSRLGRRLSRRCWPGPVTLVFQGAVQEGLASRLPAAVRRRVCPDQSIGLRVPAHDAILHVLRQLPGPLVLTSANRSGEPEAITGQEVLAALGEGIDLVVDDGPSRFGRASSVVRVEGEQWQMLREGVVPPHLLERVSATVILFVCTGNTCRSPLAEGLCRKLLAGRLGCDPAELPRRGFVVLSAGISAMMGGGAAGEAVEAGRHLGIDLQGHRSQPLTGPLLAQTDYVFAMTNGHLAAVAGRFPRTGYQLQLLSPHGADISDPIGGDQQVYEQCAAQIIQCLEQRLPEILP